MNLAYPIMGEEDFFSQSGSLLHIYKVGKS